MNIVWHLDGKLTREVKDSEGRELLGKGRVAREPRAESQVQRPEPVHMDTLKRMQATDEKPATQTGRGVATWARIAAHKEHRRAVARSNKQRAQW